MTYRGKSTLWILLVMLLFLGGIWFQGDVETTDLVVLLGLCFACELIDSGLGMGYGTILTPTLLLIGYQPEEIVPTILFSELLSGFTAAFFHNEIRNVDFSSKGKDIKPAMLLAGGSVAGVSLGVGLTAILSTDSLKVLIGCIILLSGFFVLLLSQRIIEYRNWKMLGLSGVAAFNKAVSGGGYGPLVTSGQILTGVSGKSAVGITSFAEACTCLIAVGLFLVKGGFINFAVFLPMCCGALTSVPFSVFAVNKTREGHLRNIIGVLTMGMGALTISRAIG